MIEPDAQQTSARTWFEQLRDEICETFETLEDELGTGASGEPAGRFERRAWDRIDSSGGPGGGGVMSVMNGRLFEKVGVNVSTVFGKFSPEFAQTIQGAAEDPSFYATGISLVAHMWNPHVPAVHMNTRFLATTQRWFGGGIDLNPPIPVECDVNHFHAILARTCERHDPEYYPRFSKWCEEYFYIPHRQMTRGAGGIFYDQLSTGNWDADFAFTQDVGRAFLEIFPRLVRRRMHQPWSDEERDAQLRYRGRYAEFNLIYDRGTLFGLKTGGNIDAILMSLPPLARWS